MANKNERNILEILKLTANFFADKGFESSRVDAEILLSHVLQCKRFELYMRFDQPLSTDELDSYRNLVKSRAKGKPVQHLTGEQEFYDLKLQVNKNVLVPRMETEILVETIFNKVAIEGDTKSRKILELGVGSGAISIALAASWPAAEIWAVDISFNALEVAKGNIAYHGLTERIHLIESNLFDSVDQRDFDVIVSNPPYIKTAVISTLDTQVKDQEPMLALDGGFDGLSIIRPIIDEAPKYLADSGWLFLEIGADQGEQVSELLDAGNYNNVEILKDLSKRDRIAVANLNNSA